MKVIASLTLSGTDSRSLALADGRITVVKPALCAPSTWKRNWGKKVVCWIFHLVPNSSHRKHKAMQRDLTGHCLDCPRWANKKSDQPDPCEQDVRWGGWPGWWRWSLLHSVHPEKETSQLRSLATIQWTGNLLHSTSRKMKMDVTASDNTAPLQPQQLGVAPERSFKAVQNVWHLIQERASSADSRMTDPSWDLYYKLVLPTSLMEPTCPVSFNFPSLAPWVGTLLASTTIT